MKNTKLGSVQIYYSAYNKDAGLEKNEKLYWSLMQLIAVTISLLIHSNPTATAFTKLYICLYEVKRLSNMPKNNSPGNSPGRGLTKGGTGSASEDQ